MRFLFIALILISSCGLKVPKKDPLSAMFNIDQNKISSKIRGVFIKARAPTQNKLKVGDKEYSISDLSSPEAKAFIDSLPEDSETQVEIDGEIVSLDVVIKYIQILQP